MNWKTNARIENIQKKYISDLEQFFADRKITTKKIKPLKSTDIKFYEIHFDNEMRNFDLEQTPKDLLQYGYIPKQLLGSLPDSFHIIVLKTKELPL